MRGPYWGSGLDLTAEQQARLRDLNLAPKRDNAAIDTAYKESGKLQQQMYDSAVAAQKRMETVLTKEQQEKLRTCWRRGPAPEPAK